MVLWVVVRWVVQWVEVRVSEQRGGGRYTSYSAESPVICAEPREQVQRSTSEPAQQSVPPESSGLVQYSWLQSGSSSLP